MRAAAIAFVFALVLAPSLAFAQATPPAGPGGPPPGEQGGPPPGGPAGPAPSGPAPPGAPPGAISRDQFIELRAQAAGRLFDEIDTDHKGYITREQMRAYIRARRGGAGAPPPQR